MRFIAERQKGERMNDLISRQDAIDALDISTEFIKRVLDENIVGSEREKYSWGLGLIEACIADLKELPSAEPERKTGRWVKMSDADGIYWACSECGEDIPRIAHFNPQFDLFPRMESIDKTKYCPNCGSPMEVKNEC